MEERKFQAFKHSNTYQYARFVRSFSLLIGCLLLIDFILPPKFYTVDINGLETSRMVNTHEIDGQIYGTISDYYLQLCNRKVQVNRSLYEAADQNDRILVRQSRLFREITGLRLEKGGFRFGSSGDAPIYPVGLVLIFPLITWVIRAPNEPYFRMIFATNIIGSFTLFFILFESWRILRLLQIFGCG